MIHNAAAPPPAQVMHLVSSMWAGMAAGTLARLRICDQIAAGATTPGAIAERISASPDGVARLLRAAAMLGLVTEVKPRSFALTEVGELLRTDHPKSMRALLDTETAPGHWLPWMRLDECVRRGQSLATEALGMELFQYYVANPEEGKVFAEGMTGLSMAAINAVAQAWTPPAATTIVDVGGSQGAFLRWVLSARPEARGVLFDLPTVLATAAPIPRAELIGGDFFASVPAGGDLYLLKHILHDWDDARCKQILGHIRAVMAKDATVAIVEMLIPDDGSPSPAILLDLNMLVLTPGRERTQVEMTELIAAAGLTIQQVVRTQSPFSLIEARAA